jgi:hypothetical protein
MSRCPIHRRRHTSDIRAAKKMWLALGGSIVPVCGTGEVRYLHPQFSHPLRVNDRRKDVVAKLMSRINQVMRARPVERVLTR